MNIKQFISIFETACPEILAMPKDPIGLQIGDLNRPVASVLVTLDVRPEVVKEAIEKKVDVIFSHHPLIFHPIKQLDLSNPNDKMIADLIKHNITVYSAHTNLDIVPGGMNDWFCEKLELSNVEILHPTKQLDRYDISLKVAPASVERVYEELEELDFPVRCSLNEEAFEWTSWVDEQEIQWLQTTISEAYLEDMSHWVHKLQHHADLEFNVTKDYFSSQNFGLGRVGELPFDMAIDQFLAYMTDKMGWQDFRLVEGQTVPNTIKKIAILAGDGGNFYNDVYNKSADLFITGDLYYHTSHDIMELPFYAVDPGHYMEHIITEKLVDWFKQQTELLEINFIPSQINTDPFKFSK